MGDYFLCIVVRGLSFVICLLPIKCLLLVARILGKIFYYILHRRARICFLNLKLAFGETLSLNQRRRITCEIFENLVMNFVEFLYFPRIDTNHIKKYIKIVGKKKIDKILSRGRGLIFLTAHFGNWELSSLVGQMQGYPMVVLARRQKFYRLNSLLNSYRQRLGSKVISRGSLMRELLSSLRNNEVVGILGDQKAGRTGILVDFFGRLAWTPTGAITLSRHIGAGILPVFMIREKGPFHRIEIRDELTINREENYRPLSEFNQLLEEYIRKYPSQWLWFHRRWKASPNKNILILSDGKAGHLNQAKAVLELIEKLHREKFVYRLPLTVRHKSLADVRQSSVAGAYRDKELIHQEIVEVKLKNKLMKGVINLFRFCASRNCVGCLRCLKLCLEKDSYKKICSFYADMVISCGSNLAALNLILAKENQAKSIVIMKPGLIPVKKFDLAIIPAHDRPKPLKNIVVTQAALSLINEISTKEGMQDIHDAGYMIQVNKAKIGVLIGGDSKNYKLTEETTNVIIDELLKAAKDLDAQILLTTSRRTSQEVDRLIKERLSENEFCPLLIIANEKNIEGGVAGILGLSDIVVVSGESISMISEALSSAKPVVVFEVERRGRAKDTKQKRFLDNLLNQNYLTIVKPQNLAEKIKRIYHQPQKIEMLRDRHLVSEVIRNLI